MRIAVVGLGVAGSYLLNRLSSDHDVTGYEMQKEGEFQAVCLVPSTPIITERGVIPISEVKQGDLVLTHRGRFRRVLHTSSRFYSGTLVKITPKYTNLAISLTPEHPISVANGESDTEFLSYGWTPAGNLEGTSNVKLCVPSLEDAPQTDPFIHPRLIGYYLAEGFAGHDEVYFYFAKEGEEKFVKETVDMLSSEGYKCHVEDRKTTTAVVVYSLELATLLRQFGNHSYEKHLPIEYLNLSKESVVELLIGLFRGDGCFTKDGLALTTTSLTLVEQVHLLLRRFGILTSVRQDREAGGDISVIGGRVIQRVHTSFRLDVNGHVNELLRLFQEKEIREYSWSYAGWVQETNTFLVPIRKIESEPYTGIVHNLEVEEDNSYQTIVGCLHNCAWGTSRNELSKIMNPLGVDFEKYVLFNGKQMSVDLGKGRARRIPLIGLVTYDKHRLESDLTKGKKAHFGVKATPTLLKNEGYDMIIDCTSLHRAFLPKIKEDLWIPCVEYKLDYGSKVPFEDFFIRPFNQLSGYFWYFPLEDGCAYVGAGDYYKKQNEYLDSFNKENPGKVIRKIGRPIRISPPKYCEPFYVGNVVGCGESIGTVFPLLGEGIIPSLQCAELLCENLANLPAYRDAVMKKFDYFNYVYDMIKLKFAGKFSMVRHLPLLLKTYNAMKKMEDRFGMEVRIADFKDIVSTF